MGRPSKAVVEARAFVEEVKSKKHNDDVLEKLDKEYEKKYQDRMAQDAAIYREDLKKRSSFWK